MACQTHRQDDKLPETFTLYFKSVYPDRYEREFLQEPGADFLCEKIERLILKQQIPYMVSAELMVKITGNKNEWHGRFLAALTTGKSPLDAPDFTA